MSGFWRVHSLATWGITAVLFTLPTSALAANVYWVGSGGDWSDGSNWSTTSGGASCSCVPGSSDTATFDDQSGNAVLSDSRQLAGLDARSTFASTLDARTGTLTIGSSGFTQEGGAVLAPTGTLSIQDGSLQLTGGTFGHSSGTIVLDIGTNLAFTTGGSSLYNLTLNRTTTSGTTRTLTITGDTVIENNFVLKNEASSSLRHFRVFGSGDPLLTVGGNLQFPSTTQTANAILGSSVAANNLRIRLLGDLLQQDGDGFLYPNIEFAGTTTQQWQRTAGFDYNDFTIAGTRVELLSDIAVTTAGQDIFVTQGILDTKGNNITVASSLRIDAGATLALHGTESMTMPTLQAGSTVMYQGLGAFSSLLLGDTYANLTFNNASSTWNPAEALQLSGKLTVASGTFVHSSADMMLAEGIDIQANTTFTKSATGAKVLLTGSCTVENSTSANLGVVELQSPAHCTQGTDILLDSLTIGAGSTYQAQTHTLSVTGDIENAGVFTAGSSTVALTGASQTLSGSIVFHNLNKVATATGTLKFGAGDTYTINDTAMLKGIAGGLLQLRSAVDGTQWNIVADGRRDFAFLDVQDSVNTGATVINCVNGCTDSGNNIRWNFVAASSSSSSSSSSSPSSVQSAANQTTETADSSGATTGNNGRRGEETVKNAAITAFMRILDENPEMVIARNVLPNVLPPALVVTGGAQPEVELESLPVKYRRMFCRIQPRVIRRNFRSSALDHIARRLSKRWNVTQSYLRSILLDTVVCN